jgi:chemotaxis protein methyltransferase CheR
MNMEISKEELSEIVHLINQQYGYDFNDYAQASMQRRFNKFMQDADISFFDLRHHIINDKPFFFWLLNSLTVNVTEMFRDPRFYKIMLQSVLPKLSSYPIIKIWHAGCATGEEVFSIAILLHELGILNRCKIYATDLNINNIETANSGIIPLQYMKNYTLNYLKAGGISDFSNYYTAMYGNAIINKDLRNNILFSQHNLVTDQVFNEFHLIICRNVLIYFNKKLQNQVVNLLYNSLSDLGYIALGIKESLLFTDCRNKFDVIDSATRIYRRKLNG